MAAAGNPRPSGGGKFSVVAKGDRAEIFLYDVIGGGWLGGISAEQFANELRAAGAVKTLDIRINSEGGDVFTGRTIYTLLSQHTARKIVHIDALAASIASVIAMAGDEIRIADGAFVMIHNSATMTWGNAAAHQAQMDLLRNVDDTIVGTYAKRTGQTAKAIRSWMDAETWMPSQTAKERGFADVIAEPLKVAACLSRPTLFRHPPAALLPRPGLDAARAKIAALAQRVERARGAR